MVQSEINGKNVDGTTRVCEAMVIAPWFIDDEWCIRQCAVPIMLLPKSLCGEKVARKVTFIPFTELRTASDMLVSLMRDCPHELLPKKTRPSQTFRCRWVCVWVWWGWSGSYTSTQHCHADDEILYPNVIDIGCFLLALDELEKNATLQSLISFQGVNWHVFRGCPI